MSEPAAARREDRRWWARYEAGEVPALLEWDRGSAVGRVQDIGGEGAAVALEVAPPPGVAVRLRVGGDSVGPIEARPIRVSEGPSGERVVHLEFAGLCPMEVFELVTRSPGARVSPD